MKLYYNTKGYGVDSHKPLFTLMSDDLSFMWNIDITDNSNYIENMIISGESTFYKRPSRYDLSDFIYIRDITNAKDVLTVKHTHPEFFL